jgi:oligosaccharyltransferase complex subunit beta
LIQTSQYARRPFIMTEKPLLYRGIGLKLVNFENYQLYELITSESTAFSKNYIKDSTQRVGSLCLAAAVQGLNNARALILGSTEFFSDELFNLQEYGNKEAAIDLIAWTFQKSGVIRARDMFYHGEGAAGKETLFNVGEKIYYQVEVEIQDGYQWVPYSTNDLQVEFVMLDPWVRVGLQQQNSTSTYSASFYVQLF